MGDILLRNMLAGARGRDLRRRTSDEWHRTLRLNAQVEDAPDPASHVTLSARRDSHGIPLNRVRRAPMSRYHDSALEHLVEDLPRRLRPLGAGRPDLVDSTLGGAHLSGTLRMGDDARAVVDSDCRHRRRDNLYVAGAAVFPTFTPAHPTLTIAAFAIRLGRKLVQRPADT